MTVLGLCAVLYVSLWCSYLYFHGTITDSEGDEVPIYEALHHFFTSPWLVTEGSLFSGGHSLFVRHSP